MKKFSLKIWFFYRRGIKCSSFIITIRKMLCDFYDPPSLLMVKYRFFCKRSNPKLQSVERIHPLAVWRSDSELDRYWLVRNQAGPGQRFVISFCEGFKYFKFEFVQIPKENQTHISLYKGEALQFHLPASNFRTQKLTHRRSLLFQVLEDLETWYCLCLVRLKNV